MDILGSRCDLAIVCAPGLQQKIGRAREDAPEVAARTKGEAPAANVSDDDAVGLGGPRVRAARAAAAR